MNITTLMSTTATQTAIITVLCARWRGKERWEEKGEERRRKGEGGGRGGGGGGGGGGGRRGKEVEIMCTHCLLNIVTLHHAYILHTHS